MIHVRNLSKKFGAKKALDEVSFAIAAGQYVALLGANGAGKTTLTRILATLARPSAGHIKIAGFDAKKEPVHIRQRVGVMTHASFLYDDLTAEENLHFYGRMYGVDDVKARITDLLNKVGLYTRRHDLVRIFSRGMQQRLSLARAILHQPPLLLLDEPFAGLDVNAADMLKQLLDTLIAGDCTVLLTVHDIDYALQNSSRTLILKEGKLIVDQATKDLRHHEVRRALVAS
ncbi:heme ABC exporter ATP-binding protein CcmA [candidate division KSB1 bacterium]|nr:heme ABC exporter ATP-binding protein CcmA [candidate division KSB1 bacterium]RQW05443.1 MAG: heme ABC exporter ATP-binding protein CcmA [candidate division KSB1 bacterium]